LDLLLVVTGQIDDAEALWQSDDFSGKPLDRVWEAAESLPYSFRTREHFADVLKTMWSYTRKLIVDTLRDHRKLPEKHNQDPDVLLSGLEFLREGVQGLGQQQIAGDGTPGPDAAVSGRRHGTASDPSTWPMSHGNLIEF